MWFEIIPAFAIISTVMAAPHGIAYIMNWLVVGNFYRRELLSGNQRLQYLRDRRLMGDAYKMAGLENIPDEEPVKEECDPEECECPDDQYCENEEFGYDYDPNETDQSSEDQNK